MIKFYNRNKSLASIIEKRTSLHKHIADQQLENDVLKSQIGRLQTLANLGTVTCMIAHEINNFLTPLANYSALALNNPDDKALTEKALQKTVQNCSRASKIMESMLAVVNNKSCEKENSLLISLVEEIFSCLCRDFTKDGIIVNIRIPEDLAAWAVPVQIQQVLMNLILNARDVMLPKGGVLTVKAEDDGETVQIEVSDTGAGIEPADLERIFEPFFTTKADKKLQGQRSGSGLGLAFCRKIVDEHNGTISVESKPNEGTIFRITLPKSQ